MAIPFTTSDVWLLLAIALAQGEKASVPLKRIFYAGDAINKSVFTPQELHRGFAKLIAAGLVADEPQGTFGLAPSGRALMEDAGYGRRAWFSQWDYVERKLGATRGAEDSPSFESAEWFYSKLTAEDIRRAEAEYRAEFDEELAEYESKRKRKGSTKGERPN